jgi:carotenoid cleavage dioxygenase-like enzyme
MATTAPHIARTFPQTMDFAGFNAPSRIECDIYDLVVEGEIPTEIHGSWFRSVPDPQYPPMLGEDTYLSGDGMVSVFRFEDGHVDFRQRYVRTQRFLNERKARRSLHGLYRNPYTDDPSVRGQDRGTANTTPIWHAGRLLAAKEDSLPYEVHPDTLDTIGRWDYEGALRSPTMTAHPRIDFETGEMLFFGYEAGGIASRDVAFCVADADGRLVREDWFEAPYPAFMHDFVVTREHVIFPVFPTVADRERIEAGGPHWIWEPHRDAYVGVMPRHGSVSELRWFRHSACSAFHFMNGYTEGEEIHIDFGLGKMAPFPFIQKASGVKADPKDLGGNLVRWTLDLSQDGDEISERVLARGGDFPIVADRDHMRDYEIGYYETYRPEAGPPLIVGPVGPGFNTVCRIEVKTGRTKSLSLGETRTVQEAMHIPSEQPGHEGYLIFAVDLHDEFLTDVVIVEAEHLDRGPIARIKMPFRLRCQVHGTWVSADALEQAAARG